MENYRVGELENLEDYRAIGGFTKHKRIEPKEVSLFIAMGVLLQESLILSANSSWFDHLYQSIIKLTSASAEILESYVPMFKGWNQSYQSFLQEYIQSKKPRKALKALKNMTKNPQYLTLFSVMAKSFLISVNKREISHKIADDDLTPEEYRTVLDPLCSFLGINIFLVFESSKELIKGSEQGPLLAIMTSSEAGTSILHHELKDIRELHEYPFVVNFEYLPKELNDENVRNNGFSNTEATYTTEITNAVDLLVKGFEPNMLKEEEYRNLVEVLNNLKMNEAVRVIESKVCGKCSHHSGKFRPVCGISHCIQCLKAAIEKAYDEDLENVACSCQKNLTMKNIQDILNISQ